MPDPVETKKKKAAKVGRPSIISFFFSSALLLADQAANNLCK